MAAAEETAASDGFARAQLWVRVTDPRANMLYRHRGFERTGDEMMLADERVVRLERRL
jgi:hypothetical protein